MNRAFIPLLGLLLAGCGGSVASQSSISTAQIRIAPSATLGIIHPTLAPSPTLPAPPPVPSPTPSPVPSPAPVSTLDQFRSWMEEARVAHPYSESIDTMWAVMLCESSGNPDVVGSGIYHGLFQYTEQTWSGEWNIYRDAPIFDPRAQIFATAKAWNEGNQQWWGCY